MKAEKDFALLDTNKDGKKYTGYIIIDTVRMEFTLNLQSDNSYRGRMVVISPLTGRKMKFKQSRIYAKTKTVASLSYCELNPKKVSRNYIKDYITKKAKKIYTDNINTFLQTARKSATPSTVTPILAGKYYGSDFCNFRFADQKKMTQATVKNKYRTLQTILDALSQKPMVDITSSEISKSMKDRPKAEYELLKQFWDYCLVKKYCYGQNPVIIPMFSSKSAKKRQTEVKTLQYVPEQQMENLINIIMTTHGGPECGVALLASGFSVKQVCGLKWSNILWPETQELFAVVNIGRPDVMCPIHDYTRPVLPFVAQTLYHRYSELKTSLSDDEIRSLPVASVKSNPTKGIRCSALVQESKQMLVKAGIGENKLLASKQRRSDPVSARILAQTYKQILSRYCGITEGSGTYKFLLGWAIYDDVTSANYVSFNCPAGLKRLYKLLSAYAIKKEYKDTITITAGESGDSYNVFPKNSRELAGMICEIELQPGQSFQLSAETGITGKIVTQPNLLNDM